MYGPSGTIEILDVMCLIATNVVNEKVNDKAEFETPIYNKDNCTDLHLHLGVVGYFDDADLSLAPFSVRYDQCARHALLPFKGLVQTRQCPSLYVTPVCWFTETSVKSVPERSSSRDGEGQP